MTHDRMHEQDFTLIHAFLAVMLGVQRSIARSAPRRVRPRPKVYGSDRGFYSESNLEACRNEGVKIVCIPQRGGQKTSTRDAYEKSAAFKQGLRFRAGIEGRISVLFRGRDVKRCLAEVLRRGSK